MSTSNRCQKRTRLGWPERESRHEAGIEVHLTDLFFWFRKKVRTLMSSIVGPGHDPLNNTFDYTSEIASKLRSVPEEEWATLNFELSEEDAKGRISDLDDYAKRWRESPRLKDVDSGKISRIHSDAVPDVV